MYSNNSIHSHFYWFSPLFTCTVAMVLTFLFPSSAALHGIQPSFPITLTRALVFSPVSKYRSTCTRPCFSLQQHWQSTSVSQYCIAAMVFLISSFQVQKLEYSLLFQHSSISISLLVFSPVSRPVLLIKHILDVKS
jgi:hypothetical protein